jgi:hypothetical protein
MQPSVVRRGLLLLTLFLVSAPAVAGPIIFEASGTAADGRPDNGRATFTISATSIRIVLENTAGVGQLGGISSVLDGISFVLTGGSPVNLALSSVASAAGALDCTAGNALCTPIALPASPFEWLFNASTFLLAPNGLKPYGIVNSNITGNTDGVRNAQHNPYLLGPVTFTINFSGVAPTDVSAATFLFGTVPDRQTGDRVPGPVVPEPASLLLVGTGLLAGFRRWRRRRA